MSSRDSWGAVSAVLFGLAFIAFCVSMGADHPTRELLKYGGVFAMLGALRTL